MRYLGVPSLSFANRIPAYRERIEAALDAALPDPSLAPQRLHEAMRYAVLGGGKRLRPILVYATGEALGVSPERLDAAAVAIELMHAFSLIHDDLPAMDDDDMRRGRPSTHRAFDEATAILAADALQPLAFQALVANVALDGEPDVQVRLVQLLSECCGPNGIAGGQAMDLAAERQRLDVAELEHMFRLKTGRLLRASVLSAAYCAPGIDTARLHRLEVFADALGIAYQIRDDILDFTTADHEHGSDSVKAKATYPALFGLPAAAARADALLAQALEQIADLGAAAEGLRWMTNYTVLRSM
ncbi:MAG: polyprenyl synthetase family protein [Gammaproteobacteria bacterium]|nr:polyprenyl synthetase family protein [Gammaproteobacteria bacterium]